MKKDTILVYTDGSCWNGDHIVEGVAYRGINGGAGVYMKLGEEEIKYSDGAYFNTTNIRMELLSVILALELLHKTGISRLDCNIEIHNDCLYVVNTFSVILNRNPLLNVPYNNDLWGRAKNILKCYKANVTIQHVKGHQSKKSKDEYAIGNNLVHDIAYKAGKNTIKINDIKQR